MTSPFTEDTLAQQITVSYLGQQPGCRSVYVCNDGDQ